MKPKLPAQLSLLALTIASANAAFISIDNFDSYAADSAVNGQGGWTATGDTSFVADPDNAGNQVLSSAETGAVTTTDVYHSIPTIGSASTGTIFFRARPSATADFVVGSSDVAAPSGWADFEGYMRFASGNVDVRNGGAFATVGTYNADEWYNVWLVLDHTTDTTTIHFSQGSADGGTAAGSGGFRTSGNTVHDDIISVFIRNNDASQVDGFVDDIYVDTAGANLTNPVAGIPEPATGLLGLIGLALGLRRRR